MTTLSAASEEHRIPAGLPFKQKIVKSACRVLEILELFDELQRPSSVMEIADRLGYPQSSTSALLRSLVALGYLNHDRYARSYVPSSRVALVGSWVDPQFIASIVALMKELNEQTGDTVVLGVRNCLNVQVIHVIQSASSQRLPVALGAGLPLVSSAYGYSLLSALSDAEVTRLVMRSNAESAGEMLRVDTSQLLKRLADVRHKGYAFVCDQGTTERGAISTLLARSHDQQQMCIGIYGLSQAIRSREDELVTLLRRQVELRFGQQPWGSTIRAKPGNSRMEGSANRKPLRLVASR